jgi:hypothetical protein
MFFPALACSQADPERGLDQFWREGRHSSEKMIDHDIRKAALKHFMSSEWISRIFPHHLWAAEQIGDMAKPLALCRRFYPARLATDLTARSGIHAKGPPSVVVKYMTYDASKFKGFGVFQGHALTVFGS